MYGLIKCFKEIHVLPAGYHESSEMSTPSSSLSGTHIDPLTTSLKTPIMTLLSFKPLVTIWHMTKKDYDAKLKQLQSEDSYFDRYKDDRKSKSKSKRDKHKKKDKWGDWN